MKNCEDQVEGGIVNPGFASTESAIDGDNPQSKEYAEGGDQSASGGGGGGCSLFGAIPLPCCKPFLTAPWLLVFLCWASTVQGMVINGFVNVVVSSLERRFELQSTQTGVIAGCYDIGSMLSVIPISYFGGRLGASKPRYIALGLLVMGAGSLLFGLPHFVADRYLPKDFGDSIQKEADSKAELCGGGDGETEACKAANSELASSLSNYRYYFIFGQVLHGVGAAPLITLGTTLLDESVSKTNSPLYIGIFQTMFVVGPAIGYIVGGRFLAIYTDFNIMDVDEVVPLTSGSPLWVGAWWVGFMLTWLLAWACAFFVALYPSVLPGAEMHNQVKATDGFGSLKELPVAMKELLLNPTYMFINLGSAMDGFSISCLATFMPKYMQYQYGLTSGFAAVLVGIIVVPAGGGGTLLGGYLTRRLRLTRSGVIQMYMWCQLVTVPMALGFLLTCPNPDFPGVNVDYHNVTSNYTLLSLSLPKKLHFNSSCNDGCGCSQSKFDPVCGSDQKLYFNLCFAGCSSFSDIGSTNGSTSYSDCSCVDGTEKTALKQQCDVAGCSSLMYGFVATAFILVLFTFVSAMPSVIATLRAVAPVHRSLALGMGSIVTRILGAIPGPILFGYLIDETCLLWQRKSSSACDSAKVDEVGSCQFYDNYYMGMKLLIVILSVKALAVLFFGFALFFSKRSPIKDAHED